MQIASAVGEPQLRWVTEMSKEVLSEYNDFGEQCFGVYWTSLLKATECKTALTPGQALPIVGALLLRMYKAMMSRKCCEIPATRRQALEKAERIAREELRGLLKATGDSDMMPELVLPLAAEQCDGGGQPAAGRAAASAGPWVHFTESGAIVEDEAVKAHEAGFRPGMKVVAGPKCEKGLGGKHGVVKCIADDGVEVLWDGVDAPVKHEASVLAALTRNAEMERQQRADEAARKKRKLEAMPPSLPWRSACEEWSMENTINGLITSLYHIHVTCGSEHQDVRIGLDDDGYACLYAATDLKASGGDERVMAMETGIVMFARWPM